MKAKVFMLSLVVALTAFVAQAQEAQEVDNRPAYKTEFEQDPAAHWFIELHGGAAMLPFGNKANKDAEFVDRISPVVSLSFGRWHSPYFATRLRGYAWNVYSFEKPANELVRYQNVFGAASLEFMFDLVNYFAPYRENRVFHLIPFVGLGAHMKFYSANDKSGDKLGTENDYSGLLNGGLALKFRLGKRVDLNLEGQMMVSKNNYQGTRTIHQPADVMALVSAGLTFKLGRVAFQPITPMDYDLVNDLNGQISSLRAQNAELSKRPVSCPECPEVTPQTTTKEVMSDKTILFKFDSSRIDKNQMITLYNVSEYVKANNTPILVIGYADTTGDANYNLGLSERRAKAVANALINDFGVSADMITTQWEGATDKLFDTKAWNRVVIIRSK